jgi:hypothetical protein
MTKKPAELEGTTMRVTKRTTHMVEYLKGLLKVRTGRDYSPDEVVWEALNIAFADEIKYASQPMLKDEKQG